MKAAYYTKKDNQAAVLHVGDIDEIATGPDEVQIQIHYSGINPGEISKGALQQGVQMPSPIVIPHSDGAGIISKTGLNVPKSWIGKKVLCFGAQSYRSYGTAAEYCSVPLTNVIEITDKTSMMQAAQMGIPAMTGYMAIYKAGDPDGRTILVQGGAGAVGQCAIQFAKRGGALVLATVTREEDIEKAKAAGASEVFVLHSKIISEIRSKYPQGIHHVAEVSFSHNLIMDLELLKNRGSIATYSSSSGSPTLPLWEMIFDNISIHFLGSDNFSIDEKRSSLNEAVSALDQGWQGLEIAKIFKLDDIFQAHDFIRNRQSSKRVLLKIKQ